MQSYFSVFSEKLKQDSEYQQLLADCEKELERQFVQYYHSVIPVVQENYIYRNQTLTQCFNQLETYRMRLEEAYKHIRQAGESFTKEACERAISIGEKYEREFIAARDAKQAQLTQIKQQMSRVAAAVRDSRLFLEDSRAVLEASEIWKMRYQRGMDFYERMKQLSETLDSISVSEMRELFYQYYREHDEIQHRIRQAQLSKAHGFAEVELEISSD